MKKLSRNQILGAKVAAITNTKFSPPQWGRFFRIIKLYGADAVEAAIDEVEFYDIPVGSLNAFQLIVKGIGAPINLEEVRTKVESAEKEKERGVQLLNNLMTR